jgi:preprotein translocase SecE subunit
MAMSVAENAPVTTERTPRSAQQQLAVGSFLGAAYVLISLWLIFAGIPYVWGNLLYAPEGQPYINEYLSATLEIMLCGLAAVGLGYLGYQLIKNQHQPGLRAGIFFASAMTFLSVWIAAASGNGLEPRVDTGMGIILTAVVLVALLGGTVFLFLQPGWGRLLETVEEQGWFQATPFKASQGLRVRRGTVLGVLVLGACGIYTLVMHRSFGFEASGDPPNDWYWFVPFTEGTYYFPLMHKVHLLMPVVLALVLIYFAWRLVNVPVFADFLIATEAEMNKVSWTTRRRLIQDTIVVLTTVFLMTLFLFLIDIMWIQILSNPFVSVLKYDPRQQQQAKQEKNQW